jgi:hypothetical protein
MSLSAPLLAQVGIGLSPMRVEVKLTPGQSYSGALELTNEDGGRMRIRGELLDFMLDPTMTPQFARSMADESAWSCRGWLTVNPMESELGDKERLLIRYTIRVPKDAPARSYHCAAGFTALPPVGEAKVMGIRNLVRAVAAIYVTVGENKAKGEVSGLNIETKGKVSSAVISIRNDSEYHFRPAGKLELLSGDGKVLETLDVPSFPVLPRREQRFVLPIKTNPAAVDTLRVRVDLGMDEVQEATIRLEKAGDAGN